MNSIANITWVSSLQAVVVGWMDHPMGTDGFWMALGVFLLVFMVMLHIGLAAASIPCGFFRTILASAIGLGSIFFGLILAGALFLPGIESLLLKRAVQIVMAVFCALMGAAPILVIWLRGAYLGVATSLALAIMTAHFAVLGANAVMATPGGQELAARADQPRMVAIVTNNISAMTVSNVVQHIKGKP